MEVLVENLKLGKIPEKPQTYLIVNFIIKLLLVAKKDTILVIYNRLLEIIYFVITIKKILAEELIQLFRNNIQKLYRLLKNIMLDRRLQFIIDLTNKLNRILEIKTRLLMAFYL